MPGYISNFICFSSPSIIHLDFVKTQCVNNMKANDWLANIIANIGLGFYFKVGLLDQA